MWFTFSMNWNISPTKLTKWEFLLWICIEWVETLCQLSITDFILMKRGLILPFWWKCKHKQALIYLSVTLIGVSGYLKTFKAAAHPQTRCKFQCLKCRWAAKLNHSTFGLRRVHWNQSVFRLTYLGHRHIDLANGSKYILINVYADCRLCFVTCSVWCIMLHECTICKLFKLSQWLNVTQEIHFHTSY